MSNNYKKITNEETGEVKYIPTYSFKPVKRTPKTIIKQPKKYYKMVFNSKGEYVREEINYDEEIDKYKDIELSNLLKNNISPSIDKQGHYVDNRLFKDMNIGDAIKEQQLNKALDHEIKELTNEADELIKANEEEIKKAEKEELEKLRKEKKEKEQK